MARGPVGNLSMSGSDFRLVCSCSAMETHFMKLMKYSSDANVASKGSLNLCSE